MSFTKLDPSDFVVSTDSITAPAWSSNVPVLTSFWTASAIPTSAISADAFYINVYQQPTTQNGAAVQFSIAYGNTFGSGSKFYNNLVVGASPSQTTYKQYRTMVYGTALTSSTQGFNFGGTTTNATEIHALNVDRNRYKESLFPGTFNLKLSGSAGGIQLTDNSNQVTTVTYLDCGRVFDLISGSYGLSSITTNQGQVGNGYTAAGSYGYYLPDIGTIILNTAALALSGSAGGIGLTTNQTSNLNTPYTSVNNNVLFNAMSASGYFQLNSQEAVSSDYVFIRIKNSEYNYTSNPTYISGSGDLVYSTLIYSPQTYITTVGLYNNNNELLAVGKLSRPLLKDFTKEALIRVKLDW